MPTYRVGRTFMRIRMTNTKRTPAPLHCRARHTHEDGRVGACCAMATLLCDAPVGDETCSMPVCAEHAVEIGPEQHLCPDHATKAGR